jgi:hypothetical protein
LVVFALSFLNLSVCLSKNDSEIEILSPTSIKEVIEEWRNSIKDLLKKSWEKRKEIWQVTQRGMKFSFEIIKTFYSKVWEWIETHILSFPPIERKILKISEFFLHRFLK